MGDSVNLCVPLDERFRGLAPEVGGRYIVAAGGSEADAGALVNALSAAISELASGSGDVELDFRSSDTAVEVTVRCDGKSSVVTQHLPAAST